MNSTTALSVGFNIRKDTYAKKKHTSEITSRVFIYCKQGCRSKAKTNFLKVKCRAETRIGCDVGLFIKLNKKKNNWFVNHFIELITIRLQCKSVPTCYLLK